MLVTALASCSGGSNPSLSTDPSPEAPESTAQESTPRLEKTEATSEEQPVQERPSSSIPEAPDEKTTAAEETPEDVTAANQPEETPDSEVAAVREEALETAIADGNLTPLASNCRMGQCVESYYTFTTLVRQVDSELLHSTELITFHVNMDGSEPGRWVFQPAETLVLCSTQRPLVIYQDSDDYILDHINPGQYPPGFGLESHSLYWAICHNVENVLELSASAMAEQSAELGYGTALEPRQTRTPVLELFEG